MPGYNHTQGSANTTWTITHGLNSLTPAVDFWVQAGSPAETTKIIPSSVTITDANTVTATFSTAQSGKATAVISDVSGYDHTQASASTTWTITHNLNAPGVAMDCIVLEGGNYEKILPLNVVETDTNTITVTFSTAHEGYARIVDTVGNI